MQQFLRLATKMHSWLSSPMNNETTPSAREHYEIFKVGLSVYNCGATPVVSHTGYDVSKNTALSLLIGPVYVECYFHHYNLAQRVYENLRVINSQSLSTDKKTQLHYWRLRELANIQNTAKAIM